MVRGRTTAPVGQTLGHEITGEIVQVGDDVLFLRPGDICSVPFKALEKILDLTMLSDIFPTGYHGAYTAGVTTGSTVYVAGAGPVGLAAAHASQLLGAAVVIVGDMNEQRLQQSRSFGCETVNLASGAELMDLVADIVGEPEVDAAVDAVGFEARGHGKDAEEAPATVLNDVMSLARAGASLGIPGLYVTGDPGGIDENAKIGQIGVRLGLGWAKSHSFTTGQCPVKRYNRKLMNHRATPTSTEARPGNTS